jgi:hypothetical protein
MDDDFRRSSTLSTVSNPPSTAAPAASHNNFSAAEIIGTIFGVIGTMPVLLVFVTWLFTYRRSQETGRQ